MDHRAISDDGDLATIPHYLPFTDLEQLRFAIDGNTDPVAARIPHRGWTCVLDHRKQHVAHLAFIFRRHQDDVRNRTQVRDVEQPVVSLAVAAGDATTIETELHVEILNAD